MPAEQHIKVKLQAYNGPEIAIGPGKAALLEAIDRTGSISAAGRELGLSYRRAWLLADVMNRSWAEPLITTAKGGSHGGGACLTALGHEVLTLYRDLERAVQRVSKGQSGLRLMAKLAETVRPAAGSAGAEQQEEIG
jgi:molybdate transport system regulatory protein